MITAHIEAQQQPSLRAVPRQEQTVSAISFLPLRFSDTSWWVEVYVESPHAPLSTIEHSTRFHDERPQPLTGNWPVSGRRRTATGRILVRCASSTDYERPLGVRLRAHAVDGSKSPWVEVRFPPPGTEGDLLERKGEPVVEEEGDLPVVTVEVGGEATLSDVRRALHEQAREVGGERVRNLRIVGSSEERVVFAADPVRPDRSTPTVAAVRTPVSMDEVLGDIVIPLDRS